MAVYSALLQLVIRQRQQRRHQSNSSKDGCGLGRAIAEGEFLLEDSTLNLNARHVNAYYILNERIERSGSWIVTLYKCMTMIG